MYLVSKITAKNALLFTREKTKVFSKDEVICDHHDADGLAGLKTWKTTQITMRGYKYAYIESVHYS
jgi:hypothetical protein